MKNNKITHLVTSGMIASTLLLSLGTGSAFANEDGTETIEATEAVENETEAEGTETTTEEATDENGESEEINLADENGNTANIEQVKIEAPSVVPGDFFYFVKLMTEKIRLAFTLDEYKEAQLLADIAAERIAEANSLLAEGKTDEAAALLKEAISTQELAGETLTDPEEGTEAETSGETEAEVSEGTVESKLAHNIDSLLVVLGKVENPTAQQAIMKNIQKSFVKLEKKFTKLEAKDAKFADKIREIEEKVASEQISEDEATLEKSKLEEESRKKEQNVEKVETTDVEEINNEAAKETSEASKKAEEKQQEAANKAVEKQQEAANKAAEKQQDAANEAVEKQQKAANKEEEKQGMEAKKSEGN
jgi:hypothetical protein